MKKIIFIFFFITINIFAQDPFDTAVNLISSTNTSQAVAIGDYNNDGWVDLVMTRCFIDFGSVTFTPYSNLFFENNGSQAYNPFISQTVTGLTTQDSMSGSATWGDVNNDGYIDLIIANTASGFSGTTPNYWRNDFFLGSATGLIKQGASAGTLTSRKDDATHPGWGDYNNDGYLDIFIDQGTINRFRGNIPGENLFWRGNGDGTFIELEDDEGNGNDVGNIIDNDNELPDPNNDGRYKTYRSSFGWSDYDNDGDMDIFNVRDGGQYNFLWTNSGGTFSQTQFTVGITNISVVGVSWGDYDNDLDQDLFLSNRAPNAVKTNFFYKNNTVAPNTPNFEENPSGIGSIISNERESQGSLFIDFDNDGDLDLFISNNGNAVGEECELHENSGYPNYTFSQRSSVIQAQLSGHGAAAADWDNDGDLDVVLTTDDSEEPKLYRNKTNTTSSINTGFSNFKLVGTSTNYSAIGSHILISATISEQRSDIPTNQMREISSQTGLGGQNDMRAHFGLGSATKIDEVRAQWLNSTGGAARDENVYTDLPINKFMIFTQGNLSVTADVIKNQNFMHLFGNTGGSVEFTASDPDGGALTMQRTDSDPGGTFTGISGAITPGGGTIIANAVFPNKYWTVSQTDLTGFSSTVYFDGSGLTGDPDLDNVVLVKRAGSGSDWEALNTSRIGNTLYSDGITSFSEFAIGYEAAPQTVVLELKIFLEGAYDPDIDMMRADINTQIPATSPYTEDARTVASIPADIVDWILVELRETDNGPAVVSKSAFLHKDGRVVNDDATAGIIELEAEPGSYYIVIKHRNHLSVMSTDVHPLNGTTSTLYDFTN